MALKNHAMEPGRTFYIVHYYNSREEESHYEEFEDRERAEGYAKDAALGCLHKVDCDCAHVYEASYLNSFDKEIKVSKRFD